MTVQEWSIVIGVLVSGLLALGPWMFMVHAKLAVIADQIEDLCDEAEKLRHYPRVIAKLKEGRFTDRRVCEDIERLVQEAMETAEVRKELQNAS